jgi:two-component system response regulator NreC
MMRVLIADDNAAIRRGIATLLGGLNNCHICGEAADSDETVRKAQDLRPDIVLLDVSMPGASGLDTTRTLRQRVPDSKVLIISQHDVAHLLPASLEAGAVGCVDKARVGTDLLPAIQKVFQGPPQ